MAGIVFVPRDPSWPEWARWIAMDHCGCIYLYSCKPILCASHWRAYKGALFKCIRYCGGLKKLIFRGDPAWRSYCRKVA